MNEEIFKKRLTIELTILQAISIIGNLQLALRHPANNGPSADIAKKFIERLREIISKDSAELDLIIQAGYNPDFDCSPDQ